MVKPLTTSLASEGQFFPTHFVSARYSSSRPIPAVRGRLFFPQSYSALSKILRFAQPCCCMRPDIEFLI